MSAPTAPTPSTRSRIAPGQLIYAVRSWEGDEEDITLYTTFRSAKYGASNIALDMSESTDPELFAELEKLHDPDEVIERFTESATRDQGWGGVSILTVMAPH